MDTPEDSKEQNPQILRYTIEQNIIRLQLARAALAEFLEFRKGGRFEDVYKEFFGYFRLVVGLTTALQDVEASSEIVKKAIDFLQPPSNSKMWTLADDSEAIHRARDGLVLSQEYMNYLGSKGILSISR